MKIGDEVYVHGYVDEIRQGVVIIRNDGGYFGTVPSEIKSDRKTEPKRGKWISDEVAGFKCCSCNDWNPYSSDFCPNCGADMREREGE